MPIPQITRVNPLDLQKNIAIGVSIPFVGPFKSTYTTTDQIKSNLINLLLTSPGERVMNPTFGCDIKRLLFEGISDNLSQTIINRITTSINIFIPEVKLIDIVIFPDTDSNSMNVEIKYQVLPSNTPGQLTIQFETLL